MLYDALYHLYNFHVNVNNYVVELSVNLYLSQSPLHHTAPHRNAPQHWILYDTDSFSNF